MRKTLRRTMAGFGRRSRPVLPGNCGLAKFGKGNDPGPRKHVSAQSLAAVGHNVVVTETPQEALGLAATEFEQVQFLRDPQSGARAIVALHDTRLGPAFGGIRRRQYPSTDAALADVLRLAEAMTYKCAMAGIEGGGGKAVLLVDDGVDRAAAYQFLGAFVEQLGGRFYTGPDVGTTDEDLGVLASTTQFGTDPARAEFAGVSDSTADGVFAAISATATFCELELRNLRVMVQGLGAVGMRLAYRLAGAGAHLLVADTDPLLAERAQDELGAEVVAVDAAVTTECDLFAPCALGGVLTKESAKALPARAVCGGANNVLGCDEAAAVLHQRGIAYAPDFVANAGGLVHGATVQLGGAPPEPSRWNAIGETIAELLERSRREDVPAGELALREAQRRLAAVPARPFLPGK